MVGRVARTCATSARTTSCTAGRYRDFLLDAGTLFTLASFLLLVIAIALEPSGTAGVRLRQEQP